MKKTSGALWLRLLCLALCLVTLLSLAACGGAKKPPEAPVEPTQEVEATPEPTPEPTPAPTPTVESLAIYYMGEPIADNDCTMRVGETLPLSIVATPGGVAGEVTWSVDPVCEDSFELTASESDPYRASLKGVSVLPDGAGGAKISATLPKIRRWRSAVPAAITMSTASPSPRAMKPACPQRPSRAARPPTWSGRWMSRQRRSLASRRAPPIPAR